MRRGTPVGERAAERREQRGGHEAGGGDQAGPAGLAGRARDEDADADRLHPRADVRHERARPRAARSDGAGTARTNARGSLHEWIGPCREPGEHEVLGREAAVPVVRRDLLDAAPARQRAHELEVVDVQRRDCLARTERVGRVAVVHGERADARPRRAAPPTRDRRNRSSARPHRSRARRRRRARRARRARGSSRRTGAGRQPDRTARPSRRPRGRARPTPRAASPHVRSRLRSTCAAAHGSEPTPSRLPDTMSVATPTRCASTSWTVQSGVAGATRRVSRRRRR